MVKNFENIGDTKSADDAYYCYRYLQPKLQIKNLGNPGERYIVGRGWWEKTREWAEYLFFGLTCGYGVRPLRTLALTGIMILMCTLIYFSGKHSLAYEPGITHAKERWYRRLYNSFYFSVLTFTTLGAPDLYPRGGFKVVALFECYLGLIIMIVFAVTMANVWLR